LRFRIIRDYISKFITPKGKKADYRSKDIPNPNSFENIKHDNNQNAHGDSPGNSEKK
jgi:hypothetical protein